ncbi:hypothetical protein BDY21DRAFT_363244 [Lineolata rhizophorae]|uniref:UbiA prenyltransferase family-domain-containing protein n=1 Tax=Lineolata rhizophorae TaxID=578093 RepID=A0A6A6P378_9PEZI|nr:hypothetical protein BDY21DRAFT_363244 [Lineolata rhizophorae]
MGKKRLSAEAAAETESPTKGLPSVPERLQAVFHILWLMTKDDTPTFVVPNSIFGLSGALASTALITSSATITFPTVLCRVPLVLLFNWSNLLIFDLANQRLPESAAEDSLNKPWRPIPSGLMTCTQFRQCMLFAIPLVLLFNHLFLNTGTETIYLYTLTWLYNDLKGGDEGWIFRNVIIAFAFGFYNLGSLKVAAGSAEIPKGDITITSAGYAWLVVISLVVLTTMHVQDLKDVAGDAARGRRTAPIVLGDLPARLTIAIPVLFWTLYCAFFWRMGWLCGGGVGLLGAWVAWRCVALRGKDTRTDRKTWQLWCAWTAVVYLMPARPSNLMRFVSACGLLL